MKRLIALLIASLGIAIIAAPSKYAHGQSMTDYCVVPAYVVQNIPPNVMIVMDNSGSMEWVAYFDGYTTDVSTDDNLCTASGSPCTGFTAPGVYPAYKYYGYFNNDYWYTYSTNRFVATMPKTGSGLAGARAKLATEWDGNFLNWLTMRRTDILRKVLTGGAGSNGDGAGFDRLIGEAGPTRYKRMTAVQNYVPTAVASGDRCITVGTSGSSAVFQIRATTSCTSAAGSNYNVAVRKALPIQGVLQEVATRVRYGLGLYTSDAEGGLVQVAMSGASLSATVNQINLTAPSGFTPLAETLWSMGGYYAQAASFASGPGSGGPGPRYHAGDYQLNATVDPLNYGTGGQPRYPSCAKNFVLFVTDGEPTQDGNLPTGLRDYANGKSDYNCTGTTCPAVGAFPSNTGTIGGMEDVALYLHTTDLRSGITGTQSLTIYPVFAFGRGSTLLKYTAINGGFEDSNGNGVPDLQSEWDADGDGVPDNYFEATDGAQLETALRSAISSMLARVSSGTAASVLASGEGSGANLIQASFFPRRRFQNETINWIGGLQNLWYHLDPYFAKSNIREDTVAEAPNRILNLKNDFIMQFFFDTATQSTRAARWRDATGTGFPLTVQPTVPFEQVKNIWDAGSVLWNRDLVTSPRSVYTSLDASTMLAGGFSTANAAALAPYLQAVDNNLDGSVLDEADKTIRYVHGEEIVLDVLPAGAPDAVNDYRTRQVAAATGSLVQKVWKLGDILNSTPKIASWVPLNHYYTFYKDATYDAFTKTTQYQNRGAVYVGANDGMLHAFNLGKLELKWDGQLREQKARLTGTNLGGELWSYIPKNVLPYLKYLSDPDYCHVYTVDLTPFLFDASIGKPAACTSANYWDCDKDATSWRTIIIGGMRYGGGCRNAGTACTDADGDGAKDCVNTPVSGNGYSSYFALDVTDQNNPTLLWEFSNDQLGFATTGPGVLRISAADPVSGAPIVTKNGRWFVVFGSGPTGPIDTTYQQFLGKSDQNLRFFILDLKTGQQLRTIDTGIPYAFAGSMYNSTHDVNWSDALGAYQDDVIYAPFVKRTSASPYTWTQGGVLRIFTKESLDVNQWVWSKVVDDIGPVTSAIAKLDDKDAGNMWLYFGTGRYYFAMGTNMDDRSNRRTLYGVKEPCASAAVGTDHLQVDPLCTTQINTAALTDVTNVASAPTSDTADNAAFRGWFVNLEAEGSYTYPPDTARNFGAERVITDPVSSTNGLVYFTSYKPYSDECALGGKTFIWALQFNTGAAGTSEQLQGRALVQVSTGSIEEINLGTAMTQAGGRRTTAIEGEPPGGQGMALMVPPKPVQRILQIQQR